jgi:GxxExxY protein
MRMDQFHAGLTYKIIGAAKKVHRTLGSGFLEKVYANSLAIELTDLGLTVQVRHPIDVRYNGVVVGEYFADLLVDDLVILEIKALEQLCEAHEVQLVNYLRATSIELGLLINFGPELQLRRRILTNDRKQPSR